ncbi:MAG: YidC/Oxa1 family rane protein insertase [Solirubrobacteraceae bacterium]|jgi:YidC/Oxa1 family membrane protein insertase|nr:YidC/Oxa1 family rane protein insertase [Solirubrobacteraceae bacterium]
MLANIFQPLIDVFDSVIQFFHDSVGLGWGMSIIALTIVVRTALIPLTLKQFKSMQAMQRLAPEIKALQAKYKDDKQRQQQEMMAFYKEHKVNPFGSCLPLLLQMPVFLSLFYMLRKDLKVDICPQKLVDLKAISPTHHVLDSALLQKTSCGTGPAHFLFINDITTKATGGVLVVLIVLYIGSQLASSVLMSMSADRNQRLLMIGLPFLFVTFIISFPAGLIVYWITTNLWTVGQQYFVRRSVGPIVPLKPALAGAGAAAVVSDKPAKGAKGAAKNAPPPPKASGPPPSSRKKKKRSGRRR